MCGAPALCSATLPADGFNATVPPTLEAPGAPTGVPVPLFPGYDIERELGRGAWGIVYRARQTGLNRPVALKVLCRGAYASAEELARFRREARALAALRHPHVVQVYDAGEHDGCPFLVLELVDGGTLTRHTGAALLPPKEAAALVEQLARAMHTAHEQGIIHRDLKPGNVLLAADGTPKVTDFGLA